MSLAEQFPPLPEGPKHESREPEISVSDTKAAGGRVQRVIARLRSKREQSKSDRVKRAREALADASPLKDEDKLPFHGMTRDERVESAREAKLGTPSEIGAALEKRISEEVDKIFDEMGGGWSDKAPFADVSTTAESSPEAAAEARSKIERIPRVDVLRTEAAVNKAHEQALEMDLEAKLIAEALVERRPLTSLVEKTTDPGARKALEDELNSRTEKADIVKARERAASALKEAAKDVVDSYKAASEGKETAKRIDRSQPDYEVKAAALRAVMTGGKEPFLEVTRGGLFHLKANRGPRVIEKYYVSPDNPKVILLDRVARKNGELISQTLMTSKEGLRTDRQGRLLPKRDLMKRVGAVRSQDQNGSGYKAGIGDYVAGVGDFLPLEGSIGRSYDRKKRVRQRERGGFLFWLLGGGR